MRIFYNLKKNFKMKFFFKLNYSTLILSLMFHISINANILSLTHQSTEDIGKYKILVLSLLISIPNNDKISNSRLVLQLEYFSEINFVKSFDDCCINHNIFSVVDKSTFLKLFNFDAFSTNKENGIE
jgi:hypothetical protein